MSSKNLKQQPKKKKQKILVTGGAGFIGSHLINSLLNDGHTVSCIDDLSGGKKSNVHKACEFFLCDLRDQKKADRIISSLKPDIVYHLAANAAENKAQFSPIDITSRNYNTFINTLVPALRNGMHRIIVTSSIAVYGGINPPFKESDVPVPEDLYGISKLMIEDSLKILAKVHEFEYVITRPHNVYGPRQNMTDPYRNVITIFMNALLKNESYYIYGNGEQRRCFSYVDDVVQAIYNCGFYPVSGKIFNIGADKDYSLNEVSNVIQNVSGMTCIPKYISKRQQEIEVAIADHTQARRLLDYKDSVSLEEGIQKTWEYAKSLGVQKLKYTKIELESPKLPANWHNET